jgi:copper chaperone CopZ
MIQSITFQIIGAQTMHCDGCANAVQRALARLPGIHRVTADYRTQRIDVRMEPAKTDIRMVQDKLEMVGYDTVVVAPAHQT